MNTLIAAHLADVLAVELPVVDDLEVDRMDIFAGYARVVIPVDLLHQLVLLLVAGQIPDPQHRQLQALPQLDLAYLFDQPVHKPTETVHNLPDLALHVVLDCVDLASELSQGHHLVHQALAIVVAAVVDAEQGPTLAPAIDADVRLGAVGEAALEEVRVRGGLSGGHGFIIFGS